MLNNFKGKWLWHMSRIVGLLRRPSTREARYLTIGVRCSCGKYVGWWCLYTGEC